MDRTNYDDTARFKTVSIKLEKISIKNIVKAFLTALVVITPLIFATNTKELFEFPKMFFVYYVGTTAIFLYFIHAIINKQKTSLPGKPIILWLLINLIGTAFSMHKYTSIWGYYTRFNGGLVSVTVFVGLFVVVKNVLDTTNYKHLLEASLLSTLPIGAYAIAQHFDFLSNIWQANAAVRAFSTFGQPNWLAAYLAMQLPVILYMAFSSQGAKRGFWTGVYLVAFSGMWFSYSISGLVGFTLGAGIFAILNFKKILGSKKLFVGICVLSLTIAILTPGIFKQRFSDATTEIKNFISVRVVYAQENYQLSDSGRIRKSLWEGTWNLITSSPKNLIIGTGPETFAYTFQPFRPASLNYSSEWDYIFNKPHNYYLEIWANVGIVGLLIYLVLIQKTLTKPTKALTPAMVAFFVTNIFGWPTVATTMLFWFYLAYWEIDK